MKIEQQNKLKVGDPVTWKELGGTQIRTGKIVELATDRALVQHYGGQLCYVLLSELRHTSQQNHCAEMCGGAKNKAFTVVELFVVLVTIVILTSMGLALYDKHEAELDEPQERREVEMERIKFDEHHFLSRGHGLTHDPDCPCMQPQVAELERIKFDEHHFLSRGHGLTHDPDCPCMQPQVAELEP